MTLAQVDPNDKTQYDSAAAMEVRAALDARQPFFACWLDEDGLVRCGCSGATLGMVATGVSMFCDGAVECGLPKADIYNFFGEIIKGLEAKPTGPIAAREDDTL